MKHGSLFSGIGGFDLAAEWMGWENLFHCEIHPFCQQVLKYHFPESESYGDIKETDFTKYRGAVDLLSGGFPCQPYSTAGKRLGKEDDRHLWPEMLRAIREIQPRWVVGENVRGLVSWSDGLVFEEVQTDLEAEGYQVQPFLLPASSVKAWHTRYRIWFVAYRDENGFRSNFEFEKINNPRVKERVDEGYITDTSNDSRSNSNNREKRVQRGFKNEIPELNGIQRSEDGRIYAIIEGRPDLSTPVLCGSYDGIPNGVDRVASCGNGVVPQLVYQIFQSIGDYEKIMRSA